MNDFDYWDIETGEGVSDAELHQRYDELLDEVYEEVKIGYATFSPSEILRELAQVDYRCGFCDWLDSELGETITETEPAA